MAVKSPHRWDNRKNALKGAENRCIICGVVRRWMNSRDVMYLLPSTSGWVDERPECRPVVRATETSVPGFVMLADAVRGDLSSPPPLLSRFKG